MTTWIVSILAASSYAWCEKLGSFSQGTDNLYCHLTGCTDVRCVDAASQADCFKRTLPVDVVRSNAIPARHWGSGVTHNSCLSQKAMQAVVSRQFAGDVQSQFTGVDGPEKWKALNLHDRGGEACQTFMQLKTTSNVLGRGPAWLAYAALRYPFEKGLPEVLPDQFADHVWSNQSLSDDGWLWAYDHKEECCYYFYGDTSLLEDPSTSRHIQYGPQFCDSWEDSPRRQQQPGDSASGIVCPDGGVSNLALEFVYSFDNTFSYRDSKIETGTQVEAFVKDATLMFDSVKVGLVYFEDKYVSPQNNVPYKRLQSLVDYRKSELGELIRQSVSKPSFGQPATSLDSYIYALKDEQMGWYTGGNVDEKGRTVVRFIALATDAQYRTPGSTPNVSSPTFEKCDISKNQDPATTNYCTGRQRSSSLENQFFQLTMLGRCCTEIL